MRSRGIGRGAERDRDLIEAGLSEGRGKAGAAMGIVSAPSGSRHQIGCDAQGSGLVGGERGGWVLAAAVRGGRGVGSDCRHSGAQPDRSSGGERKDLVGRDRRPVRKARCCVVAGS